MAEAETWIAAQPKLDNGKVDIRVVIVEGRRRGYCICPKPMRQMINVEGFTCSWCGQKETSDSWEFWYGPSDAETTPTQLPQRPPQPPPQQSATAT